MKAFLDYMKGLPAVDDFVNEIDGFIKEIKVKEEERVSYMTYEMKMREAHDDGVEEGEEKKGREIVRNMIQIGFDNETIRKVACFIYGHLRLTPLWMQQKPTKPVATGVGNHWNPSGKCQPIRGNFETRQKSHLLFYRGYSK